MTSVARPSYVFLLHCEVCDDVVRLRATKARCACGIALGKYITTSRTVQWNGVGRILRVLLNTLHAVESTVFADPQRTTAAYFTGFTVVPPESALIDIKAERFIL